MGRGRARARQHAAPAANPAPSPTAQRDDGSAIWELDPFVVSAHPASGIDDAVVVLDGKALSPGMASTLADALRAAALRAERGPGDGASR